MSAAADGETPDAMRVPDDCAGEAMRSDVSEHAATVMTRPMARPRRWWYMVPLQVEGFVVSGGMTLPLAWKRLFTSYYVTATYTGIVRAVYAWLSAHAAHRGARSEGWIGCATALCGVRRAETAVLY